MSSQNWSTHQSLKETWLGDHPMYKTVEGFVISIVGIWDDEDEGVSFDSIYDVVDDYVPSDSPEKKLQPTRKHIKRILDSYEKRGILVLRKGLYYFSNLGQVVHSDIGSAELGWQEGSIHGVVTDKDDPEAPPIHIHPDSRGEIILPINRHLWEEPKE